MVAQPIDPNEHLFVYPLMAMYLVPWEILLPKSMETWYTSDFIILKISTSLRSGGKISTKKKEIQYKKASKR